MATIHQIAILLFFSAFFCAPKSSNSEGANDKNHEVKSDIERVKNKLFNSTYDKNVRPESHHNHTTHVVLVLNPIYLQELDEEKSLFTIDVTYWFEWEDKRLNWNSAHYGGLPYFPLPDQYVWKPDIRVYNAHMSNVDPMRESHVLLLPGGRVYWYPPATVTAFCDVTTPIGSYPYDTHVCNITTGSWTHDGWQINISIKSGMMGWGEFHNVNTKWEVITEESKCYKVVYKYDCCEEPYISINAMFVLKRRFPAELQVVFVPCILTMMLTLGMFCVPSHSGGKKIILGASLLIALTALMVYCAAMTASPRAQLRSVSFVQSTMIAIAIALTLEVLLISLGRMNNSRRPPEFLVLHLSGRLGDYMCVATPWKQVIPAVEGRPHDDTESINSEPSAQQQWLLVATGCDRVLFIFYIAVFATIHQL